MDISHTVYANVVTYLDMCYRDYSKEMKVGKAPEHLDTINALTS